MLENLLSSISRSNQSITSFGNVTVFLTRTTSFTEGILLTLYTFLPSIRRKKLINASVTIHNLGVYMTKKAIIIISLVPEANKLSNKRIEIEIRETLRCDWLAEIEKVTVKNED